MTWREQIFAHWRSASWLDVLQGLAVATALWFCVRGVGIHLWWLLLAGFLPVIRCLVQPDYRVALRGRLVGWWRQLSAYPQAPAIPWVALFFLVFLPGSLLCLSGNSGTITGDSKPALLTAISMVRTGGLDLDWYFADEPDKPLPYYARTEGDHVYSGYPVGMTAVALPIASTAYVLGADLDGERVHPRLEKWAAVWVAGACLALFFLCAAHLAPTEPAYVVTVLLATGSVMFSTVGQALWQHGGVIIGALTALLIEFRQPAITWRRAALLLQAAALAFTVACRPSAALLVLAFGTWVLFRAPGRAILLGACTGLAYAPWALFYFTTYGKLLGPTVAHTSLFVWSAEHAFWAGAGVLVSPARGLFVYQPWLLLAALLFVPAIARAAGESTRAVPRGWQWFALGFIALHLAMMAVWCCWWGGGCWGSRLLAETVPFFALFCLKPVAVLWRSRPGKSLIVTLGLLAFLTHVPGVYISAYKWHYQPDYEAKLWSWSESPLMYPLRKPALPASGSLTERAESAQQSE